MKQYIFRQYRSSTFDVVCPDGLVFDVIDGPWEIVRHRRLLRSVWSWKTLALSILKVLSKRRVFYFISVQSRIIHHGWVSFGFCRYYCVEVGDSVIGPIWTHPEERGRGLATQGLKSIMDTLWEKGRYVFYIDTSEDNVACLKSIEHCGFGEVFDCYERGSTASSCIR